MTISISLPSLHPGEGVYRQALRPRVLIPFVPSDVHHEATITIHRMSSC